MKNQPPEILPTSIPVPTILVQTSSYIWFYLYTCFKKLPGTQYIISYVRKSHQDDPYRTMVEIVLIIYGIIYFLGKPSKKGQQRGPELTSREVESLLEEWEPEPLVQTDDRNAWRLQKIPVVHATPTDKYVDLTRNDDREVYSKVLNCASNNFLQISRDARVLEEVKRTIKNYGVGSCGPAGFYGNQDVHSNLEYDLARFFGTESAVLYGQDFCVAASVIPAFTKRGDVIVADDRVSVSLQNALQLSRSTVYYFKHNDMESLEDLLRELTEHEKEENLPALPRKFIVTEGLFHNLGDIAPLPDLVRLKEKYKYRLFVDETFSLGVLGNTGRGITEHFNLKRETAVDITVGSMATAFGSSGGFALGDHVMSHHQRIGSFAYCYSASLPAYTVRSMSQMLGMLEQDSSAVIHLHELSASLHSFFKEDAELAKYIEVTSCPASCILHFRLTADFRLHKFGSSEEQIFAEISALQSKNISNKFIEAYEQEDKFLQSIVDSALADHNVLITRNTIVLKHETLPVTPSLKFSCNALMTEQELQDACVAVKNAVLKCCA